MRVVTPAAEVAVEDAGDQHRMARGETGMAIEGPVRHEPVGVQHQRRARRPRIGEFLNPPDVVPRRPVVRHQAPGAAVRQDRPADVPDPREVDGAAPAVDLRDRDGGAPRRTEPLVDVLENLQLAAGRYAP